MIIDFVYSFSSFSLSCLFVFIFYFASCLSPSVSRDFLRQLQTAFTYLLADCLFRCFLLVSLQISLKSRVFDKYNLLSKYKLKTYYQYPNYTLEFEQNLLGNKKKPTGHTIRQKISKTVWSWWRKSLETLGGRQEAK